MDGKRKGFLVALVIGLVAAPALALVASGLLGGQAKAGEPATASAAVAAPVTDVPAATATTTSAADLQVACTTEGADLVAQEAAGILSDLQQAALDSLRPICQAEGFSLEAAPVAEAPVTAGAAPTTTAPAAQFEDDGDEGAYEDEGEYEDNEDESNEDESGDHEEDD